MYYSFSISISITATSTPCYLLFPFVFFTCSVLFRSDSSITFPLFTFPSSTSFHFCCSFWFVFHHLLFHFLLVPKKCRTRLIHNRRSLHYNLFINFAWDKIGKRSASKLGLTFCSPLLRECVSSPKYLSKDTIVFCNIVPCNFILRVPVRFSLPLSIFFQRLIQDVPSCSIWKINTLFKHSAFYVNRT